MGCEGIRNPPSACAASRRNEHRGKLQRSVVEETSAAETTAPANSTEKGTQLNKLLKNAIALDSAFPDPGSLSKVCASDAQTLLETATVRCKRKHVPTADENWRALQRQLGGTLPSLKPTSGFHRDGRRKRAVWSDRVPSGSKLPDSEVTATQRAARESLVRDQPPALSGTPPKSQILNDTRYHEQSDKQVQTSSPSNSQIRPPLMRLPARKPGPLGLYPEVRLEPLGSMIALDGEFVGVGSDGNDDALARISVVDFDESVLYDRYVQVEEQVIDFRTPYSGIHPVHLRQQNTVSFREAQQAVARLAQGRILVGHELRKDLRVLLLSHPHRLIRDTARYRPLRCRLGEAGGRTPSLRRLAEKLLGQTIQQGNDKGPGHDSVEDAITALRIYKLVAKDWERDAKQQDFHGKKRAKRYRQTLITSRGHRTSALKESTPEHSLRQNRQT